MNPIKAHQKNFFIKHRAVWICLFLIAVTFSTYYQTLGFDFVNFDDDYYVTENSYINKGITQDSIKWSFIAAYAANWHPITWLSHMLDCHLFGLNPSRHHLTNLLFHIANTLLLFMIFLKMTGGFWQSGFVAALFALHPLHVESVAWVSERKDVLSTFFAMLTMLSYIWYVKRPSIYRYVLIMLCLTLGLMSKSMLVTLPCVLLLMDYWPLYRFRFQHAREYNHSMQTSTVFRLMVEKIPLFVLAALSSIAAFHAQDYSGAVATLDVFPFTERIANALVAYATYLIKMVYPAKLAVPYPHPGTLPIWQVMGACLLLFFIFYLAARSFKQRPYFMVGWLWYVGTLVPVIGLIQIGSQAMADRYTYVPLIGIFVILAWGVPEIFKKWRHRKLFLATSATIILAILTAMTWRQSGYWKNGITLFEHAVCVTSGNFIAHNNLGSALSREGRYADAINHCSQALKINPNFEEAHYNLGIMLEHEGKTEEAIQHYLQAIEIWPDYGQAHNHLGAALRKQGRIKEAIYHYLQAIRINPDNEKAHYNLARALNKAGRTEEAIQHYLQAIKINPDMEKAHYNLALTLQKNGRIDEAVNRYVKALEIKPEFPEALYNLGIALLGKGDIDGAIARFQAAIRIKPDYKKAKRMLIKALRHVQKKTEAKELDMRY